MLSQHIISLTKFSDDETNLSLLIGKLPKQVNVNSRERRLTCNQSVVSSSPIRGSRCFIEQDT